MPPTDSPEFFNKVKEMIEANLQDHFVICGDYNVTLDPTLDTSNYKNINNPNARKTLLKIYINARKTLLKIIQSHNLVDAYRFYHENAKRYT